MVEDVAEVTSTRQFQRGRKQPPYTDLLRQSFEESEVQEGGFRPGKPLFIKKDTEEEARALEPQFSKAEYYLRVREGLKLRLACYVTEHYVVGTRDYRVDKTHPDLLDLILDAAEELVLPVEHFWKFTWAGHTPKPRGLGNMPPEAAANLRQKAAAAHTQKASDSRKKSSGPVRRAAR